MGAASRDQPAVCPPLLFFPWVPPIGPIHESYPWDDLWVLPMGQPKDLTHFFIKMTDEGQAAAALEQVDDIKTLGSGSQVDINPSDGDIPDSVGTMVVNDSMTVLVDLKGKVDFKTEIGRLNKNLGKAKGPMQQLEKKMATSGYQDNVPEELKKANDEKLIGLKKKCADIEEAIANFERLLTLEDK